MKTAIQQAIEEINGLKSIMQKQWLEEQTETGKDQVAQVNLGLTMAINLITPLLPIERERIETAYNEGVKLDFQFGSGEEYFAQTFKNGE